MNLKNGSYLLIFAISVLFASCNKKYTKTEHGFKTDVDSITIEVQFCSPEIVRIIKSKSGFEFEKKSLAVVKTADPVAYSVSTNDEFVIASTEKMIVKLDVNYGAFSFYKTDESKFIREQDHGAVFTPKQDQGTATFGVKQSFVLDSDEYIYGLGQYQNGKMSQRNQRLKMEQTNQETVVPFMVSNKGYGVYWDNYSITEFTDSTESTAFDSEIGDCIDYYFMTGESADGVISNMRDLTGRVPMMPYWTFGYWQSKERYKSQVELVGVVKKYRDMKVPIDGIIQDWQYWGDNEHWNAMEFLNPEFPDPQKMINDVHDLNAHTIISCWPSFGPETKQYEIFKSKNMSMDFSTWPPNAQVYDAYNPEARDIYWDFLNKGIFSLGMDGWWLDASEPEHLHVEDSDYNNKTYLGSFRRVRNVYPLVHVGGVATHQKETSQDKRVFILTRSAFAGQQRHAAVSWSGDVVTDWDVLRKQISAGLNFSLSGIPYWNSDIGGFHVFNFPGGYKNKAYHEIYVRWMQFGAFCPMMRSHGTGTPRELWYYGKPGDWTYDALKKTIDLRYSLLPYIYSTSWNVTHKNSSMMRALVMDFANDKKALDIDNQYMFGKNILVCPVTEPMYVHYRKEDDKYLGEKEEFSRIKTTQVYLPADTEWFDFWTGEVFQGGQTLDSAAPIDILPLYVKAGSIIPFGPGVQYANEMVGPLTVRVYPGADGSFTFYDDERDNYNYEKGAYATIKFNWDDASKTLTIEDQEGEYKGMPESRKISVVKVGKEKGVGLSFNDEVVKEITYSGNRVEVKL